MRYLNYSIVLEDVPDEISLAFNITGCPQRCRGCHSPELRDPNIGNVLTIEKLDEILKKYGNYISCVVFFGGDWNEDQLITLLRFIKFRYSKLKLCLYSGRASVSQRILSHLDYIKLGPYVEALGALNSKTTNQVFIRLSDGANLNHLFQKTS
jgi:anaerobic ribonucleoside-triphosphate reductase activating protein